MKIPNKSKFFLQLALIPIGLLTSIYIFFAIDIVFGKFHPQQDSKEGRFFPEPPTPPLGWGPSTKPLRHRKHLSNGSLLYDVRYTFDEYKRRVTPQPKGTKKHVILFFGGSNTFGEGLSNESTIPSLYAVQRPNSQVYNYAYKGYGPQQMLAHLKQGFFKKELPPLEGFAYYIFFDFHVRRVVGTSDTIKWSQGKHPYFTINENSKLIDRGFHSTANPIFNFLTWHLANTHIFQYYNAHYPKIVQKHYQTTCEIFKESQRILTKKKIRLVLLSPDEKQLYHRLEQCLGENLKIHPVPGFTENAKKLTFPEDLHINSQGAEFIANWLARERPEE